MKELLVLHLDQLLPYEEQFISQLAIFCRTVSSRLQEFPNKDINLVIVFPSHSTLHYLDFYRQLNAKHKKMKANYIEDQLKQVHSLLLPLLELQSQSLAVIQTSTYGPYFELMLHCKKIVCVGKPNISFGANYMAFGAYPFLGTSYTLGQKVGSNKILPYLVPLKGVPLHKAYQDALVDLILHKDLPLQDSEVEQTFYKDLLNDLSQTEERITSNREAHHSFNWNDFNIHPYAKKHLPTFFGCDLKQTPPRALKEVLEQECQELKKILNQNETTYIFNSLFKAQRVCMERERLLPPPVKALSKVGIIGVGHLGQGIGYVCALNGITTVIQDASYTKTQEAKDQCLQLFLRENQLAQNNDLLNFSNKIITSNSLESFKDCDLIIEAVPENRQIKETVHQQIEENTYNSTIFSSNTSTMPITGLSRKSNNPQQFIGLHFFAPVNDSPLLELILGEKTSLAAKEYCLDFAKLIHKTPIIINDGRGFFISRVFTTYIEEGILALSEGFSPQAIEEAGLSIGMPKGPLRLADETGLDLLSFILKQTKADLGEGSVNDTFDLIITFMTENKRRLGERNQKGFYDYDHEGQSLQIWDELTAFYPTKIFDYSADLLKDRLLYRQILETARCFDENIVTTREEADFGSIMGFGFPVWMGGSLSAIDYLGLNTVKTKCDYLYKNYGNRFEFPHHFLERFQLNTPTSISLNVTSYRE